MPLFAPSVAIHRGSGEFDMRKFLFTTAAVVAFSSASALAADMPTKAPVIKAAPMFDWSGFYVGAHAGYGWGRSTWTALTESDIADIGDRFPMRPGGALGGGQVGYNWQNGQAILGVELSGTMASMKDTFVSPVSDAISGRTKVGPLWAATAKLGFATDRNLLYVKGGYAGARIEISAVNTADNVSFSSERARSGWTIGGGWEYAVTPTWIFGVELNHYDFGSARHDVVATGNSLESFDVRSTVQSVTARLSYRFGS
jgi:outer membrane immunogenic protein